MPVDGRVSGYCYYGVKLADDPRKSFPRGGGGMIVIFIQESIYVLNCTSCAFKPFQNWANVSLQATYLRILNDFRQILAPV